MIRTVEPGWLSGALSRTEIEYKALKLAQSKPELVIEAVALYEELQKRFPYKTVLEVCEPHPDNPSPNIQPIFMSPDLRP